MRALVLSALLFVTIGSADTVRVTLPTMTETTGAWRVAKATVEMPEGGLGPILIFAPQQAQTNVTQTSSVSVTFEINEKGVPINIQVDKSSDRELEEQVIAMIREWRFFAALRDGIPVPSQALIDLSGDVAPLPRDGRPRPRRRVYRPEQP